MLGKVLKYDIKGMLKSMMPLYLILIIVSLFSRIISIVAVNFKILDYMLIFINASLITLLVVSLLYTFLISIKKFYTSFFKDEGYLTHTLPISKNSLVLSKLITSIIYIIFTTLVVIVSVLIAFYSKDGLNTFISGFTEMIKVFGISPLMFITCSVIFLIVLYITTILAIYLSITIGHTANSNKISSSVGVCFLIYFIMQILNLISLIFIYFSYPNFLDVINEVVPPIEIFGRILLSIFSIDLVVSVINYFLTVIVMKKKLNLE